MDVLGRQSALLLYLLGEPGPRTRQEIARVVPGYPDGEASMRRQFERDKSDLLALDVPLRVEETDYGWTYEVRHDEYYLPDLKLTSEEKLALQLALSAVMIGGAPASNLLRKVGAVADGSVPPMAALPDEDLLPTLSAACRNKAVVTMTYGGNERDIDPYAVFFNNGYWYLHGFDHFRNERRTFRVDRIVDRSVTAGKSKAFTRPDDFRIDEVLPAPWLLPGDEPVNAQVRLSPSIAGFVVDSMGEAATASEPDADGHVTITFEVRNRGAFRSWLFGWLDAAEVVGPQSLRDDVIAWLEGIAS